MPRRTIFLITAEKVDKGRERLLANAIAESLDSTYVGPGGGAELCNPALTHGALR